MSLKFNLKNVDKRTKLYVGIGVGAIVFLIFLLLILKLMVGSKITSKQFEKRVKDAAISYYKKYPEKLPQVSGNMVSITIDELVSSKTLKDPNKLLDNVTCSGSVNVSNNNGYYLYQPDISCTDDYQTNLLYKVILADENIVTSGNGLYKTNNYYIFKGENLNNNVSFAGYNWQIVRVNSDNTLRLILKDDIGMTNWDNRYNVAEKQTVGKNDYTVSRIKDKLNVFFEKFNESEKALIVPSTLCIGGRNQNSPILSDSVECSKKLENEPIGLLQVNEYVLASLEPTCKNLLDRQCRNYNYLASYSEFWTITPNSENTFEVYEINRGVYLSNATDNTELKPVIKISSNAIYKSGDGSEKNPYVLK